MSSKNFKQNLNNESFSSINIFLDILKGILYFCRFMYYLFLVAPIVEIPDEDSQLLSKEYASSIATPLKRQSKKRKSIKLKKKTDLMNNTYDITNESSLFEFSKINLKNSESLPTFAPSFSKLNSKLGFVSISTELSSSLSSGF